MCPGCDPIQSPWAMSKVQYFQALWLLAVCENPCIFETVSDSCWKVCSPSIGYCRNMHYCSIATINFVLPEHWSPPVHFSPSQALLGRRRPLSANNKHISFYKPVHLAIVSSWSSTQTLTNSCVIDRGALIESPRLLFLGGGTTNLTNFLSYESIVIISRHEPTCSVRGTRDESPKER